MHEEEGVEVVFGTIKYTWKESMMKLDFCDGGTPTSKHKKANQLTRTFSHCLRCT